MRLIDGDELIDGYKHMGYDPTEFEEESYQEGWCKGFNAAVDHCISHVIHAPTVDPQHKVRFSDADHVWIDGKQYISLKRFGEAVKDAQLRHYHEENLLTYAHDMGVTLEQAKKELTMITTAPEPHYDEWCDDCAEYDKTTHSCPRFNHVIRTTLDDVRKEAYKHGKSKGIKRGMAMAKRKEAGGD